VQKRQLIPKILHIQYHGRETHSLCFISFGVQSNHSWLATGCEDGTVRLTRSVVYIIFWGKKTLLFNTANNN